jgi:outer membrane protein assembly factor BamB
MKRILLPLFLANLVFASDNWPSFRGERAAGVAENVGIPEKFDGITGEGTLYKVRIPGLAHSSPIVWGDKLFLTTAVSQDEAASFKPGLYGSGEASADRTLQEWKILCLNKHTGKTLWEKVAAKGTPIDKRHVKSTYANSTPCTDGEVVVAWFGSQGVFGYTVDGQFLWKVDLGRLDVGAYDFPSYEWGPASSPILHDGKVVLQVDTQGEDYLLSLDARTGKEAWRTKRDELPSWGTPTIVEAAGRTEVVCNGSNFVAGYDFRTGKELWRMGTSSKITAPTPVHADGITIVSSGRAPESPVMGIRAGAKGNITLGRGETSGGFVAWLHFKRGPYMPTPVIYQGIVHVLHNQGIFAAYGLRTGQEHYIKRIPHDGSGFSASPVVADGKIYLPGEDGIVLEMLAGKVFRYIRTHKIGEPLMASPAISGKTLYLRGRDHLFAIGKE